MTMILSKHFTMQLQKQEPMTQTKDDYICLDTCRPCNGALASHYDLAD